MVPLFSDRRYSAQEAIEDSFLGEEPEVVLVETNEATNQLMLQVVFKGMDKLSVKFEFNVDTDTAEEVVNEMVRKQAIASTPIVSLLLVSIVIAKLKKKPPLLPPFRIFILLD